MGEELNGADSTLLDGADGAGDNNNPPADPPADPAAQTGDNPAGDGDSGDNSGDNSGDPVDKGGEPGDNKDSSKTLLSGDEGEGEGAVEYNFEAPEGVQVSDEMQASIDAFKDVAKENDLSPEQFQKLVEFDIQRGEEALAGLSEQYQQRIDGWADEVRNDSTIGGEALQENLATAKSAINEFGTDGFKKLLAAPSVDNPEGLGLGNHPEVIKLFVSLGQKLSEGNLVTGDSRVDSGDSLQKMYPSMFKETG